MEFSRPAEPTQVFWGAPPRSSLPSAAWVSWALKGFWVLHECVQTAVLFARYVGSPGTSLHDASHGHEHIHTLLYILGCLGWIK